MQDFSISYPLNLRFNGRKALVVGAGSVAQEKIKELRLCGARVLVVAPDATEGLNQSTAPQDSPADILPLEIQARKYKSGDLKGCWLVVAAVGDSKTNSKILAEAEKAQVWTNAADDPQNCSAILPARHRDGPLLVTVSSSGLSPAYSTWLRNQIQNQLGPEYKILLKLIAEEREFLKKSGRSSESLDWHAALDSEVVNLIRKGQTQEAKELIHKCLFSH